MTPELILDTLAQYGLAGIALALAAFLAWKVVDRAWGRAEAAGSPLESPLSCRVDPEYFTRQKRVADRVERWDDLIQRGAFSCSWKDRDEVRDYMEAIRDSTKASEAATAEIRGLAQEVRGLTEEIRTTRNGGASAGH